MAVNSVTTSNIRYLGGKALNDGVCLGNSALTKVGFYGTTPVVRGTISAVGTTTATTGLNETKIDRLYAKLEAMGLIATA